MSLIQLYFAYKVSKENFYNVCLTKLERKKFDG
jgi:hypothetical protein